LHRSPADRLSHPAPCPRPRPRRHHQGLGFRAITTAKVAGTTGDHRRPPETTGANFRDPPPSRIMKPWPVQPQGRPAPCRDTARAATRPETDPGGQTAAGSRQPPRAHHPRLRPGSWAKITVRAFVSPMGHDHPEWTSDEHDIQGRSHTPNPGQIAERNTCSTPLREPRRSRGDPTLHSPTGQPEETRSATTSQTVRSFGQKCASS